MIPSGIEPATFRFVAQHLNHCATAVPEGSDFFEDVSGIFGNPRADFPHVRNSIGCFRHEARVVCPVMWG